MYKELKVSPDKFHAIAIEGVKTFNLEPVLATFTLNGKGLITPYRFVPITSELRSKYLSACLNQGVTPYSQLTLDYSREYQMFLPRNLGFLYPYDREQNVADPGLIIQSKSETGQAILNQLLAGGQPAMVLVETSQSVKEGFERFRNQLLEILTGGGYTFNRVDLWTTSRYSSGHSIKLEYDDAGLTMKVEEWNRAHTYQPEARIEIISGSPTPDWQAMAYRGWVADLKRSFRSSIKYLYDSDTDKSPAVAVTTA